MLTPAAKFALIGYALGWIVGRLHGWLVSIAKRRDRERQSDFDAKLKETVEQAATREQAEAWTAALIQEIAKHYDPNRPEMKRFRYRYGGRFSK
jgi:hypothetical protein